MEFIDLNLQNMSLKDEELKLGFSKAYFARVVDLRSGKDLNSVNSKELITVEGNYPDLLRNCIRQKKPLLCNPLFSKDFYKDEGLIQEALSRETVFEIPICEFLNVSFINRAKLINQTRNFIKKCLKLDAKFVFTSRARESFGLKSPRELIAITTTLFGLTEGQAEFAISRWAEGVMKAV